MSDAKSKGSLTANVPRLAVRVEKGEAKRRNFFFDKAFRIGRDESCEVQIVHNLVSRTHLEVKPDAGRWWITDLNSRNGTFIDGRRIDKTCLLETTKVAFGMNGPVVSFVVDQPQVQVEGEHQVSQYAERYFGDSGDAPVGVHTQYIRRAFKQVQARERKRYGLVIAVALGLFVCVAGYALFQHFQLKRQRALAEEIFYSMKSLEMEFAKSGLAAAADAGSQQAARTYREQRQEMEKSYDQFLQTMGFSERTLTDEDRLILRVTRVFGECELTMPPGYVSEVRRYIRQWQSTGRFRKALTDALGRGYTTKIASAMLSEGLPPQFFYLAMQESDFNLLACGPKTRMGHAKGMWQFIPETALKYGLRLGPLHDLGRPDPGDDRHDFEKSTKAAVQYLKFIYTTEAQASGLLVMACYNWGEGRVVRRVRQMPQNPRERNFWRLLADSQDRIPPETYNYVFSIVSAAVIGENPRLFGFDFENPLVLPADKPGHQATLR